MEVEVLFASQADEGFFVRGTNVESCAEEQG